VIKSSKEEWKLSWDLESRAFKCRHFEEKDIDQSKGR